MIDFEEEDTVPRLHVMPDGTGVLTRRGEFDVEVRATELPIMIRLVEHWWQRRSLFTTHKPPRWIKKRELGAVKGMGSEHAWESLKRKLGPWIEYHPGRSGGVRLRPRVRIVRSLKSAR